MHFAQRHRGTKIHKGRKKLEDGIKISHRGHRGTENKYQLIRDIDEVLYKL